MKTTHRIPKNKLTKDLCEVFRNTYGNTLWEGDTDIVMAKAVLRKLRPYLYVSDTDISDEQFNNWRKKFTEQEQ